MVIILEVLQAKAETYPNKPRTTTLNPQQESVETMSYIFRSDD